MQLLPLSRVCGLESARSAVDSRAQHGRAIRCIHYYATLTGGDRGTNQREVLHDAYTLQQCQS